MAWESRGQSRFYYTSERVDGRVERTYHGSGPRAALLARQQGVARDAAEADAAAARALETELEPLERLADNADEQMDQLLEAAMLAGGFHNHRGQWRKRHGRHDPKQVPARGTSGRPEDCP